jgi:1,4-alpha-glucan branching enzyme
MVEEDALRVAVAIQLLAPSPPLVFMGEEFRCAQPFLFFCDFGSDLAQTVTEGRRREFSKFTEFNDAGARERIPDPNAVSTFETSKLHWGDVEKPFHRSWLRYYRRLIALRHQCIVCRLDGMVGGQPTFHILDRRTLKNMWILGDGSRLTLVAALGQAPRMFVKRPEGRLVFETAEGIAQRPAFERIPLWYAAWFLKE